MAGVSTGERVNTLSLADCHAYDPRPRRSGRYLRFKCPLHCGDRQQSLAVEEATGKFKCHNAACAAWGTVTEHLPRESTPASRWGTSPARAWGGRRQAPPPLPQAKPLEPHEYAARRATDAAKVFDGSPAQEYARRRGIQDDIAAALGLGCWRGMWREVDSEWLTFPLRCPVTGRTVGVSGRNIHSDEPDEKTRALGRKGLFGAMAEGPVPPDVILVEGPFEAIACALSPALPPARALIGSSCHPEWFDNCRRVILIGDDDEGGEGIVTALVNGLGERRRCRGSGPQVLRLRRNALRERFGVKDLGELLREGIPVRLALPPIPGIVPTCLPTVSERPVARPALSARAETGRQESGTSAERDALDTLRKTVASLARVEEKDLSDLTPLVPYAEMIAAAITGRVPAIPVRLPYGVVVTDARHAIHSYTAGYGIMAGTLLAVQPETAATARTRYLVFLEALQEWWSSGAKDQGVRFA